MSGASFEKKKSKIGLLLLESGGCKVKKAISPDKVVRFLSPCPDVSMKPASWSETERRGETGEAAFQNSRRGAPNLRLKF